MYADRAVGPGEAPGQRPGRADLRTRPFGGIDEAPLAIAARAGSSAPPVVAFAVLADHERRPEWFTSVKEVTVLGPAEGIGACSRHP